MVATNGYTKAQRVRASADYQLVFAQARKKRGPGFSMHTMRSEHSVARLGVSVSKKQVKTAVQRNRLKRLIRESFRQHAASLKTIYIVFVVYRELAGMESKTIAGHLAQVWDGLKQS